MLRVVLFFLATAAGGALAEFQVVQAGGRLPTGRIDDSAMYDGEDSIYLMGSMQGTILKYSISQDETNVVGEMAFEAFRGSGVWVDSNTMIYSGGEFSGVYHSDIWRVDITQPDEMQQLAYLSNNYFYGASVADGLGSVYIIGGWNSEIGHLPTISKFSLSQNKVESVSQLPFGIYSHSAAWSGSAAYIFGGMYPSGRSLDILKYDTMTNTTTQLSATLPLVTSSSCAVAVGPDEILVIGGYTGTSANLMVIRFIPSTQEATSVPVTGYPYRLASHGCAFVQSLNRVYIFGGITGGGTSSDEILYIDLGLIPTPSTTPTPGQTCADAPEGAHLSNPMQCDSYFQCVKGQLELRSCPAGLQFNPKLLECDLAEAVNCGVCYGAGG